MSDLAATLNETISEVSPALYEALSSLGRRVAYPPDIPFQAAQARGKAFNATIGQITDGHGRVLALPSIAQALSGMDPSDRNMAFRYSPLPGIEELRYAWRDWQRRDFDTELPSTLPLVTVGLTHGVSLTADLFGGEGRKVAIPSPFWGNYRMAFGVRTGAEIRATPAYRDGAYNCSAIAEALDDLPDGEPAVGILNLPSNPGGYSPTPAEREQIVECLVGVAERRPLVVLCDDAYAGLVFEPDVPRESMFWDLIEKHENLIPIKVDGGTKEFCLFGGRVGFLTFPYRPESRVAAAMESKAKCVARATVSTPVAPSQMLLLQALRTDEAAEQVEAVRQELEGRYRVLKGALDGVDRELLVPQPFNSGCFALLELPEALGLESEAVRHHLLDEHDTGVVAIAPNYLRIAHCSIAAEAIEELVNRVEAGVRELASSS